jgi:hypothetical protein
MATLKKRMQAMTLTLHGRQVLSENVCFPLYKTEHHGEPSCRYCQVQYQKLVKHGPRSFWKTKFIATIRPNYSQTYNLFHANFG